MYRNFNVLLVAGIVLLSACSPAPTAQAPIRAVKVITVSDSMLSSESEFAAEVKARVESRLGFRIPGKLIARHVELGQRVKAGQLLAEIDGQDFKLSADSARAQVNAAQTNRDLAAADFKRFKELRDKEFISGAELERRETALKAAQAQLEQAQAQLSAQVNQVNYSKLYADKAGVVTGLDVEVGQVVNAGTPILRLAQDGMRDVVFAVPEDRVSSIKTGQPVHIKLWGSELFLSAKVQEIAASADPVTRTFLVKADLNDMKIPLGTTATVLLKNETSDNKKLTLPTTAVRQESGKSSVWLVDPASMTVQSHEIQISGVNGNSVVVSGGLTAGQQVVTAGIHVLSPGQKVTYFKSAGAQP
jgi:RND family efflux transporter MFP subunit